MQIDTVNSNLSRVPVSEEAGRNLNVDRVSVSEEIERRQRVSAQETSVQEVRAPRNEGDVREKVYGEVLGFSEDGDTVAAGEKALEALQDGLVFLREDTTENLNRQETPVRQETPHRQEIENRRETSTRQDKADAEHDVESLRSYTKDQLESLYVRGEISKFRLEQEEARREMLTKRESRAEDTAKQDAQDAALRETLEENDRLAQMIGSAVGKSEEAIRGMQALNDAAENDRLDLMRRIMGLN